MVLGACNFPWDELEPTAEGAARGGGQATTPASVRAVAVDPAAEVDPARGRDLDVRHQRTGASGGGSGGMAGGGAGSAGMGAGGKGGCPVVSAAWAAARVVSAAWAATRRSPSR